MTQPVQQETGLGDLVVQDLENQIANDPRYAAKCRELAMVRAQYKQLMDFVRSKADVLGLTEVDANGNPIEGQGTPIPQASESDVPADSEQKPINGAKRVSANTGT